MFSRTSFSRTSFSLTSYHGSQADSRSGYWRLFFYQLQEEALKEPSPEPVVAEQSVAIRKIATTKKPNTKQKALIEQDIQGTVEQPRFLNTAFTPDTTAQSYLSQAWQTTLFIRRLYTDASQNALQLQRVIKRRQQDIDTLLLLAV